MNTRSLSSPEKQIELKTALRNINHDIVGLYEVQRLRENIIEDEDYIMYHLGQTKGQFGAGFLVKKAYMENIINFTGMSERVCLLEIKLENLHFTIIQAYAPTECSTHVDLELFYSDLETAHEMISTPYIISMGDFNAQIGKPNSYEHKVLGKHGYGNRSQRGDRLIQYANEHNLKIINTMFKANGNTYQIKRREIKSIIYRLPSRTYSQNLRL